MDNINKLFVDQYGDGDGKEKKSQSQVLVGLASEMKLFYDEHDDAYAKVKVDKHYEVWLIRSNRFKEILTFKYMNLFEDKDKVPGTQALQDAIRALEAKAKIEGNKEKVYVRVAETEDGIYLDLSNEQWQVVEINKEGWKVINESPVNFKRSKTMSSLPTPKPSGHINDIKFFLNYMCEDDYKLLLGWLLSTFKANSPLPILILQGEQGSSKSTTTKVLRTLVDPSSLPLRSFSNNERDLAIAANNSWVLAFDNLSRLSNQMSDALCKISTGGGTGTRRLYTDDEETVFNIMRPIILNGIDDIGTRQDLLDRSIVINLPSIDENQRIEEKMFWKQYYDKQPYILGALCTIVSSIINELPNVELKSKPRMVDFAMWITAAEKALNWEEGSFIEIYLANRDKAIEQGIDADPFASAILELLKRQNKWVGNASQLLAETTRFTDERTIKSKAWPIARSVRNRLRRINPALKKKGIVYVEYENKMKKTLKLEKVEDVSSFESYSHQTTQANKSTDDDGMMIYPINDVQKKSSSSNELHDSNVDDANYDNDDKDDLLF